MKLTKTKEIVVIPLLLSIIFSLSISNSINNQQVMAQDELFGGPLTESPDQFLSEARLVIEDPVGLRTQYPDGWEIIIQNATDSSLSIRFNSPPENDTDSFSENVRLVIGTISNNTDLRNFTSATLTSYLELYPDVEFTRLSATNLTSSAIPAYEIIASRPQEGLTFRQVFAIQENRVYSISYLSEISRYSTYLPLVEDMINSFEVTQ